MDAQVAQRLHQVVIRFPRAENADAGLRSVMPVHAVQSSELARRFHAPIVDLVLQGQCDRWNQPRIGVLLITFRPADGGLIGIDIHRTAAVANIGDHLHPYPRSREARHGNCHQTVVDHLLRVSGVQEGNAHVEQAELALVRDGGAFRNRIVAAQHQSRAVLSGAGQVGVAKYIAAPIDTRPFSIPDPDHAFHLALADHGDTGMDLECILN